MEDNLVKEMIKSKQKSASIYMKCLLDYSHNSNYFFCFFEGEDYKYYRSRILKYINAEEDDILTYNCNGKSQVINVYNDLKKIKKIKKIFFVDKDFDKRINSQVVFQTDGYSVENYYFTENAFKRLLRGSFLLNSNDKNFKKSVENYERIFKKYYEAMTVFNSYICYIRKRDKNDSRIVLPDEKLVNKFVITRMSLNGITINNNSQIFDEIKAFLKDSRDVDYNALKNVYMKFKKESNKEQVFRGKNTFLFYKKYLSLLIEKINNNGFYEDYEKKIKYDVNNDSLLTLSGFADTSEKLISFLQALNDKYKNAE